MMCSLQNLRAAQAMVQAHAGTERERHSHLEIHLTNLYYNRPYKSAQLRQLFTT